MKGPSPYDAARHHSSGREFYTMNVVPGKTNGAGKNVCRACFLIFFIRNDMADSEMKCLELLAKRK